MSIYTDNGYENRKDYLENLADDLGLELDMVMTMADLLGPNEDFDGLVTSLEDYSTAWLLHSKITRWGIDDETLPIRKPDF
jgi:hypothetical protein